MQGHSLILSLLLSLSCYANQITPLPQNTAATTTASQISESKQGSSATQVVTYTGVQRLHHLLDRTHYTNFTSSRLESQAYFDQLLLNELQGNCLFSADQHQQLADKYRLSLSQELHRGKLKQNSELLEHIDKVKAQRLHFLQESVSHTSHYQPDLILNCAQVEFPSIIWHQQQQIDLNWLHKLGLSLQQSRAYLQRHYAATLQQLKDDATIEHYFNRIANAYLSIYDAHSTYSSPSLKHIKHGQRFTLGELGVSLSSRKMGIKVEGHINTAQTSNPLQSGDIIVALANTQQIFEPLLYKDAQAIHHLLKGEAGTTLKLLVYRPHNKQIEKLSISRQSASTSPSSTQRLNHNTAILHLNSLPVNIHQTVATQLAQLQEQGVDNLILDLRNNGGGALNEVAPLLSLLGVQGELFSMKGTSDRITVHRSDQQALTLPAYTGKLSVWIDNCTGAGAELIAASLQDHQRAIVIGSQSHGQGSVQQWRDLKRIYDVDADPTVGSITITIAMLFRPNGNSLHMLGVSPDIALPFACTMATQPDPSLPSTAIEPLFSTRNDLQATIEELQQHTLNASQLSSDELEELAKQLAFAYQEIK